MDIYKNRPSVHEHVKLPNPEVRMKPGSSSSSGTRLGLRIIPCRETHLIEPIAFGQGKTTVADLRCFSIVWAKSLLLDRKILAI